jgi:hypothetical protein
MLDLQSIRQRAATRANAATLANPANWLIQEPPISQLATLATVASEKHVSNRPYRLTPAEVDAAHAARWDDAACGRFVARVVLFVRRGIDASDADDLGVRLRLRDLDLDDRRLCLECKHLAGTTATGWRCTVPERSGYGPGPLGSMAVRPQRCQTFAATDTQGGLKSHNRKL